MPLAGDIADHFESACKANFRHFSKRRVRLLRCRRIDTRTYSATLRALHERGRFRLFDYLFSLFANKLVDGRHSNSFHNFNILASYWKMMANNSQTIIIFNLN
ncbi:hypothetical protein NNO_1980 [Hydrogenimonas sp.]|nr:hypothetical protein NNO_1980 [Hydrogenimonas sp.]